MRNASLKKLKLSIIANDLIFHVYLLVNNK